MPHTINYLEIMVVHVMMTASRAPEPISRTVRMAGSGPALPFTTSASVSANEPKYTKTIDQGMMLMDDAIVYELNGIPATRHAQRCSPFDRERHGPYT